MSSGWIGVDFDGTVAEYYGWKDPRNGTPIPAMVARIKKWLSEGRTVKIFTARVCYNDMQGERAGVEAWCLEHIGQKLEVTCEKDYGMIELYDDRAVGVEMNTGRLLNESTRGM
jgi:hypothetical protein